jgi:hypothetical protein
MEQEVPAVTGKGARTPRSRGPGLLLATSLAILGICLVAPAIAQAGASRFMVEYCDSALPGGNPPALYWHNGNNAAYGTIQTCAEPGGIIGIVETNYVTTTPAWIETGIAATPGGFLESLIISAFATNLQPGNEGSHICAEYPCGENWPLDNGGDAPRFIHVASERSLGGSGVGVNIVMTCSNSPCNPGGTIAAHYLVGTEVDLEPPKVVKAEGSLLAGGVLRGHQTVGGEATDVGGGLSRIEVLVNGLAAAPATPGACSLVSVANRSYTGVVATSPTPCPARLPGSWIVDTSAPPFHEGANTVQVCASDLATIGSPNTTCSPPQTVSVNNTCTESAVTGGQNLSANFAKTNSETVTVGFGQGAEVRGQLADGAGDPVSGATICVEAQTEGVPGEPAPIATTTTDASGQFSYELPPGPDRRVLIGYRHDAFQVGHTIDYAAHSLPTVQLRPGRIHEGDRIKITGMLPGPAAAGRVVVLQASALHGHRWLTFRKATTGPRGGFRAAYRFGATTHTLTYKIRAVVPLQNGYPYAAGRSKPGRVKVEAHGRHPLGDH